MSVSCASDTSVCQACRAIVDSWYQEIVKEAEDQEGVERSKRGSALRGARLARTIASRWPLRDVRAIDLQVSPRTADIACTTLLVEVDAAAPQTVCALQCHFDRRSRGGTS